MADTLKNVGQQAQSGLQSSAQSSGQALQSDGSGTQDWDAMSEEQKKKTFDSLPEEKKQGKTYTEWLKEGYQHQKENWMPWIEDLYLRWFTNDNKASYATKDTLGKTKVTGVEQIDNLQDGVNNLAAGQVGQGGLLQPVGDAVSKEGVNRAERGGKDDSGSYAGSYADSAASTVTDGAKSAGGYLSSGAKSVGSMFGGGQQEETAQGQK